MSALAAFYKTTETELRNRIRRDHDLWLDKSGRLLYVCKWGAVPPDSTPESNSHQPLLISIAPEDTFRLHSRPGATKIIYLDFNGFDASTTSWGSDAIGRPFDLDGDPTTFSSSERTAIQNVWLRVMEDYSMYDIDVTTEDPGVEALRKVGSTDANYGIRVVIGGSSSDWFGSAAGGVAYVGSFNSSSDLPCWVWPAQLANSEKNIAEAASHEAGHTLGLSHDGADVNGVHTEYYGGQGNWAPIMGVGYGKPITQWSKGEYANANNTQDDLAVMLGYGAAYRPDDYGNTMGAAFPLSGVNFNVPGVIERTADIDFFTFQCGAGRLSFTSIPFQRGANLHMLLSLYDSGGSLITSANPADTSSGVSQATVTAVVPAGQYYLSIEGVGSGDPVSTGYSDYASLGQYTITGFVPSDSGWISTAPGVSYLWSDTSNWASNTLPWGVNAIARVNNNIAGDQAINLDTAVTLGQLYLGDADALNSFTLLNGGGSLTFASTAGPAWLVETPGASDTLSLDATLQTDLIVSNTGASHILLSGALGGTGGFTKAGTGTATMAALNTYSGKTVVDGGTLVINPVGTLPTTGSIEIRTNGILDGSTAPGGLTISGGQLLGGSGVVTGDVTVAVSGRVAPGNPGIPGTLHFNNGLTLASGSQLSFDLAADASVGGATNDLIQVNGGLTLAGTIAVDFNYLAGSLLTPGTYTLITYAGPLSGGATNFTATSATNRYLITFDDSVPGQIQIHVSGNPVALTWHGDNSLNRWDVGAATNWIDNLTLAPTMFYELDTVFFDDTGSTSPSLNLLGTLQPSGVTVSNNNTYTFGGTGKISGKSSLLKQGAGLLALNTANDFVGPLVVDGGTLKAGNAAAFGDTNNTLAVNSGATLDVNGLSVGSRLVSVRGIGVTGAGAIINSSATTQSNALRFVTLTSDTTFGGTGGWDVRANPTASFIGNNFNLTKTGGNEVWLAGIGATGLGDITVNQGLLGIQGSTTLGDTTKTITLASGASFAMRDLNFTINKRLVMTSANLLNQTADNVFSGPVTLNGTNTINSTSILTLQGVVSGVGAINKTGPGILALTAANNYVGNTIISGGTLVVKNATSLGTTNAGTMVATGGRLDVNGINLGGEPITIQGTGIGNAGAIINNGAAQQNALRFLTLSGSATIGGISRWDLRASPTASITGNNFALTKSGPNEIWLVDAGPSGLASITINEGILGIQGSTTLGNAAAGLSVNSGATLGIWGTGTNALNKSMSLSTGHISNQNGSNVFVGNVSMSGSNLVDISSATTLMMTGPLSGTGSLRLGSPGLFILAANNTYTGPTTVSSGTLQFGAGSGLGQPGNGSITNNATLTFYRNNSFTVGNVITGTGLLNHGVIDAANPFMGSVLTLTGNNSFTGNTVIYGNGNFIAINNDNAIGRGNLVLNGNNNGNSWTGIRSADANLRTITNNVQFGAGNLYAFGAAGTGDLLFNGATITSSSADKTLSISNNTTTINNAISSSNRLLKNGPGTLLLAGNNTFNGLVINQGTVRVDSEPRLGSNPGGFNSAQLTLDGGTLENSASMAIDDSNRGITLGSGSGTFLVDPATTLTVANTITGPGGLVKSGAGTLSLNALNTFLGATTNSAGTLIVNGRVAGPVVTLNGSTLTGNGTIMGALLVLPGSTLAPGPSLGTLSVSNTVNLLGNTIMEVDANSHSSDVLNASNIVMGGTLSISNLNGSFAAGDAFKLFAAPVATGSFTTIVPANPSPSLAWDTSTLTTDGTIRVVPNVPQFSAVTVVPGGIVLAGTRGTPGGTFYVLQSTNVAAPLNLWTTTSTNSFDLSGNFRITNAINPSLSRLFYLISAQAP